jgi:hypothetical protein
MQTQPPYTPSFPLSFCPLVPTPRKDLFFPSALHFKKIKCIFIVQGGFSLVLSVWIYCAFIKLMLSPPLHTHRLSPCSPNTQQVTVQYIISYSCIDRLFQYFSFLNIFFLSPTS